MELELAAEEVRLVHDQQDKRQRTFKGMQDQLARKEEELSQAHKVLQSLQSAAHLKQISKTSKRDLQKTKAQLSESRSASDIRQQRLAAISADLKSRELKEQQYLEHFRRVAAELEAAVTSRKLDRAEKHQVGLAE